MLLKQNITTIITADEGKLLKRIADGEIMGKEVYLGYNYYEVGIMNKEPIESKPEDFTEIPDNDDAYEPLDVPENYEEIDMPMEYSYRAYKVDHAQRLTRMLEIIGDTKQEINTYNLTAEEALKVKELFPDFQDIINKTVTVGFRFIYKGLLYEVIKDLQILPFYEPSENTKDFYKLL